VLGSPRNRSDAGLNPDWPSHGASNGTFAVVRGGAAATSGGAPRTAMSGVPGTDPSPGAAARREQRSAGYCVIIAEPVSEAAAITAAAISLGMAAYAAEPGKISEELWNRASPRIVIARGADAVRALLPWIVLLQSAPNTATIALLDASRTEVVASLRCFDMWLPGATPAVIVAQQALALTELLERQAQLTGPRLVRGFDLIVDLAREEATDDEGERISLTPSEFRLLAALAVQPGRVVDFGALGSALPGHFRDADDAYNSVKVHIGRLRQKLFRATGFDGHLVSVRGRGFLFERRSPESIAGSAVAAPAAAVEGSAASVRWA